jgi:hypothetical protein
MTGVQAAEEGSGGSKGEKGIPRRAATTAPGGDEIRRRAATTAPGGGDLVSEEED